MAYFSVLCVLFKVKATDSGTTLTLAANSAAFNLPVHHFVQKDILHYVSCFLKQDKQLIQNFYATVCLVFLILHFLLN